MEKQRSRVDWLRAGDRNTAFFHAKARQRARTNKIAALRRQDGTLCTDQPGLELMAADFYRNLFSAQENTQPEEVLRHVPAKVTDLHNNLLYAPFTETEIRTDLFMMKPNKSPGLDGFTAGFYQRHWSLLGGILAKQHWNFLMVVVCLQ
jgi:hypothetical protein